ncbi:MAG: M67 family metallopeptidase [Anaerolineaceae bacterium]|nr:M67 family metallopeptidase [Anaerolineaceae bacterium]
MTERLWLPSALAQVLVQHARAAAPQEACGIIAGQGEQAQRVIPVANSATDPTHFYRMDDRELTQVLFTLEQEHLTLLGFYHSHPAGDPIPSPTDIREAHYLRTPYLIVGLRHAEPRLAAWEINHGDVLPVELVVGDTPPPPIENHTLSPAQRMAVIVSLILAFMVVIAISLALLPPAPPIP